MLLSLVPEGVESFWLRPKNTTLTADMRGDLTRSMAQRYTFLTMGKLRSLLDDVFQYYFDNAITEQQHSHNNSLTHCAKM
jgi:hypothetical protein